MLSTHDVGRAREVLQELAGAVGPAMPAVAKQFRQLQSMMTTVSQEVFVWELEKIKALVETEVRKPETGPHNFPCYGDVQESLEKARNLVAGLK